MRSCSSVETRRARPLLGTLVDVCCSGSHSDLEAAFGVIEKVHRLMSFHDAGSDISRINRHALHRSIAVHPWTWRVLRSAQQFASDSGGAFDATVPAGPKTSWRDVVLDDNSRVRFRRPVMVDLGGIAKGFAVDRAVEALQLAGVSSGIINAGGDLRVFGPVSRHVFLRVPDLPARFSGMLSLRNRAVATSGTYFSRDALVHGRTRRRMRQQISVTVAAGDCMTADALTKIVFALGQTSAPLLKQYRADALLLERDGSPSWIFRP